jgi:hypothetical protein
MIREAIGPELKRASLKLVRNRFARWEDDGWQIIDFKVSAGFPAIAPR